MPGLAGRAVIAKPAAASSFDPRTQVTALHAVWASDPSWSNPGDGNAVSSWRNHSDGGDPASSGSNRPTYRASTSAFNNHPTVQFASASSQYLDFDITNVTQSFKVVIVGSTGSAGAAERFLGIGGNTARALGDGVTNVWTLNAGTQITGGTSDTNPHVFRATLNGASSQLWVDESSVVASNAGANAAARFTIGAGSDNTPAFANYLNGHVAFVGIYDGATSDASLSTLCDDLQTYYGTP